MIQPGRLIFAVALCLASTAALAAPPTTDPLEGLTTQPTTKAALTVDQQIDQLITFLNDEYGRLLKSNDWIERSLAVISLSRLPGERATDQILGVTKKDPVPAVRIVAWQAVLSRAKWLTLVQYQNWMDITSEMAGKDLFRGTSRVGLLHVMALNPPSRGAKLTFVGIFAQTNCLDPHDMPVIDALADCLSAWRTPDLAEYLYNRLPNLNDAYRAEYILHRAGLDTPWAGEHMDLGSQPMWKIAIDNDVDYWKHHKADWKPKTAPDPEGWKKLEAQLIPRTDLDEPIDPSDAVWRKETELGRVDPKPMDVAFVVDATGSMQPTLDFMKENIGQIKTALELIANQPRIGVTFYRDQGDMFVTRSLKLTDRLNTIDAFLGTMDAHGGGDRPEAVLDALVEAIKNNPWAWKRDGRKAIVLMTDAPPHPQTQNDCIAVGKGCKDNGMSLLIMKVRSHDDQSDLAALDDIAAAAGTEPMWMPIGDEQPIRFPLPEKYDREGLEATWVAYAPPADAPDRQILKKLMAQAINPQFTDRVGPLVDVILALTAASTPEKRTPFGVPTPHDKGVDMSKPEDPQAR